MPDPLSGSRTEEGRIESDTEESEGGENQEAAEEGCWESFWVPDPNLAIMWSYYLSRNIIYLLRVKRGTIKNALGQQAQTRSDRNMCLPCA